MAIIRGKDDVIRTNCDIVIDGYPRSANTFTAVYWKYTQPHLRLADHTHHPTCAISALQNDIPVLFLIRNPKDCVSSWVVYTGLPFRTMLLHYIDYHRTLLPYLERLYIVPFDTAITRPKQVIADISARYKIHSNMDFDEKVILEKVEAHLAAANNQNEGSFNHTQSHLPSERRELLKHATREKFAKLLESDDYKEAESLYHEFIKRGCSFEGSGDNTSRASEAHPSPTRVNVG